jgi:hypothetical protein
MLHEPRSLTSVGEARRDFISKRNQKWHAERGIVVDDSRHQRDRVLEATDECRVEERDRQTAREKRDLVVVHVTWTWSGRKHRPKRRLHVPISSDEQLLSDRHEEILPLPTRALHEPASQAATALACRCVPQPAPRADRRRLGHTDRQICVSSVRGGTLARIAFRPGLRFGRIPAATEGPPLSKLSMYVRRGTPRSVYASEADPDPLRHGNSCSPSPRTMLRRARIGRSVSEATR